MTAITLDEILRKIQELMDSGEGDLGRLRFILMTLRRGNPLYKSDQKYLEKKLNTTFVLVEKHQEEPKPAFELISSIRELIKLGIGDSGRLQFIKQSTGIMPKGWVMPEKEQTQKIVLEQKRNELAEISEKIKIENDKFEEQKGISQQIEIQKSKLTQLVLNRKEYEKQVEIEKNRLEEQIKIERQKVELQTKLAEQITNQKIELDYARIERNKIVKQIEEKQALISLELTKEKQNLE